MESVRITGGGVTVGKRILEALPDRRRICVMLRGDGWSYEEISDFLGVGVRLVRHELEQAAESYPGLLDHRRAENKNRLMRLVYLMGISDAGGDEREFVYHLDALVERARWLRARMIARGQMAENIAKRRRQAHLDSETEEQ